MSTASAILFLSLIVGVLLCLTLVRTTMRRRAQARRDAEMLAMAYAARSAIRTTMRRRAQARRDAEILAESQANFQRALRRAFLSVHGETITEAVNYGWEAHMERSGELTVIPRPTMSDRLHDATRE